MELTEPSGLQEARGLGGDEQERDKLLASDLADGEDHLMEIEKSPQALPLRSQQDADLRILWEQWWMQRRGRVERRRGWGESEAT
jgi:hypothetical protein